MRKTAESSKTPSMIPLFSSCICFAVVLFSQPLLRGVHGEPNIVTQNGDVVVNVDQGHDFLVSVGGASGALLRASDWAAKTEMNAAVSTATATLRSQLVEMLNSSTGQLQTQLSVLQQQLNDERSQRRADTSTLNQTLLALNTSLQQQLQQEQSARLAAESRLGNLSNLVTGLILPRVDAATLALNSTTIGSYSADFRFPTPATSWMYQWNGLGSAGNSSSYQNMTWNGAAFVNALNTLNLGPLGELFLT